MVKFRDSCSEDELKVFQKWLSRVSATVKDPELKLMLSLSAA